MATKTWLRQTRRVVLRNCCEHSRPVLESSISNLTHLLANMNPHPSGVERRRNTPSSPNRNLPNLPLITKQHSDKEGLHNSSSRGEVKSSFPATPKPGSDRPRFCGSYKPWSGEEQT